jgi:hypothetical protein
VRNYLAKHGVLLGVFFIILGGIALIAAVVFVLKNMDAQAIGLLTELALGSFSVGLGIIAISISVKSDQRYTTVLERIDENITRLPTLLKGDILTPSGQLAAREVLTEQSKENAQKRLDEDRERVGYLRGEVFQLPDGTWAIRWGGNYPL